MRDYYDRRATEYDDWWLGTGLFADRQRPRWEEEVSALIDALASLPPSRTLDIACGTGYLTRHLPGEVVGLDQSESMLGRAREKAPEADFRRGEALELPFADGAFERVFTSFFYGHLEEPDRQAFLAEARRVAPELVVTDSALHEDVEAVEWQERVLSDHSRWEVYKRYFDPTELADELGGGRIVFAGHWFVAVAAHA